VWRCAWVQRSDDRQGRGSAFSYGSSSFTSTTATAESVPRLDAALILYRALGGATWQRVHDRHRHAAFSDYLVSILAMRSTVVLTTVRWGGPRATAEQIVLAPRARAPSGHRLMAPANVKALSAPYLTTPSTPSMYVITHLLRVRGTVHTDRGVGITAAAALRPWRGSSLSFSLPHQDRRRSVGERSGDLQSPDTGWRRQAGDGWSPNEP